MQVLRQIFGGTSSAECVQRLLSSPSLLATPSSTLQAQFEDLGVLLAVPCVLQAAWTLGSHLCIAGCLDIWQSRVCCRLPGHLAVTCVLQAAWTFGSHVCVAGCLDIWQSRVRCRLPGHLAVPCVLQAAWTFGSHVCVAGCQDTQQACRSTMAALGGVSGGG